MSEYLGARISLISRSDIRYVGTLHEINSEHSTVSLQSVTSFGTEGRKGNPDEEIAPSNEQYDYIIFRGSDVKDLRIEQGPGAVKENKPPVMPNDPAIVGASRPRPGNVAPGPPAPPSSAPGPPSTYGQPPFYPPHQGPWGRAAGPPPPGASPFGAMPYQPPPGWFPPGAQGFPPGPLGPPGPGPWSNYGAPQGPPGPQSQADLSNRQGLKPQETPPTAGSGLSTESQKAPQGAAGPRHAELPSEPKSLGQVPAHSAPSTGPPPPVPVASKPTVEEVKATAPSVSTNGPPARALPTGPKATRITQITPAVPLPAALTARVAQPTTTAPSHNAPASAAATSAALRDATQAAKAAVAVAMAKLDASAFAPASSSAAGQSSQPNGNAVDNLTKKVNEMRVNATRTGNTGRGGGRGRGPRPAKVEVPESDFDFASSNAKFNKDDLAKEAIAGSPLAETSNGTPPESAEGPAASAPTAYNKSRSFFDDISSESKDRRDSGGQKPGGREWRGEEQRKNMETFGQGSVDGGHRHYRGRGRGRGGRGRGYQSGRGGGRGGFRGNNDQQTVS